VVAVAAVCAAPKTLKADSVLKNERIKRRVILFVYNNLGNEENSDVMVITGVLVIPSL
jgi:hypothetical protein